jgi:TonB family protein
MTHLSLLSALAVKGTILLGTAFGASALLRRASAASRHLLWTAALSALLFFPFVIAFTPQWNISMTLTRRPASPPLPPDSKLAREARTASRESHSGTLVVRGGQAVRGLPLPGIWVLGAAVAVGRAIFGRMHTGKMLRSARPAPYAAAMARELAAVLGVRHRVTVLESSRAPVPLTCGPVHPAIVLPLGAAQWPEARLRTALLHELAHISRGDLVSQVVAQAACCVYWVHPLAWMAAARQRQECEHACDDIVLAAGATPDTYAADLVDLARGLAASRRAWAESPAMAETSNLETRVRALFDNTRNRRPLDMKAIVITTIAALAVLFPVASLTVSAHQASAAIGGTVTDPDGAVIPNVRVTAQNQDGSSTPLSTNTDPVGTYRFTSIPPGKYTLEFTAPGFKVYKLAVMAAAGQGIRQDANLQLGDLSESMTVRAQVPGNSGPIGVRPIKVGGMVQSPRLVHLVRPEYPADLQQAGVHGSVMIRAIISKDGEVLGPQVINTEINSRLAELALNSVKQWRYQPALLNGEPVELVTTVSINFELN